MKKCKHEWRYKCGDNMGSSEYYYCIHCLAEADLRELHGEFTFTISEANEREW